MNQQFDYQCGMCGTIHTEREWNDRTFKYVTDSYGTIDAAEGWESDEHFFPLARSIERKEHAWFHCPTCDEEVHANDPMEVLAVFKNFKNNRDAKALLEKRY